MNNMEDENQQDDESTSDGEMQSEGLIDNLGGLSDAVECLYNMIETSPKPDYKTTDIADEKEVCD